jgi:hypothetical protein
MIFIEALMMVFVIAGIFLGIVVPTIALVVLSMVIYTKSPLTASLPPWLRLTVRIVYPLVLIYLVCLVMVMNGAVVL